MVNYLTEAELKFQYLFCHKMAPWVALRQEGSLFFPVTQASKEPGDLGVLGLYRCTPISYEFPLTK